MFELLAAEMRIAELEKELSAVRAASIIDPLTGALNRRGFEDCYRREMARARRTGDPFALVLIDLDDFKRLNDTYGHLVGDGALVYLVQVLRRCMRPTDVLCRFGGEEFLLMLHGAGLVEAKTAVSRFLTEFSSHAIPETDTAMTFSAGVVLNAINESLQDALQRVDVATYAAKHSGKNRIVVG